MIPAGNHEIGLSVEAATTFSAHELQTRIMSITGNLLSVRYGLRDARFTYESDCRTLASFNRTPTSVTIDNQPFPCTVLKGNDCYTIALPPGRHDVVLVTGDQFSYDVNLTSLWSSTVIAIFGFLAVSSLALLYIVLKIVKRQTSGS
jgi:hypothetical protein